MPAVVIRSQPAGQLLHQLTLMIALGAQQPLERQIGEPRAQIRPRGIDRQRTLEVAGRRTIRSCFARGECLDIRPRRLPVGSKWA